MSKQQLDYQGVTRSESPTSQVSFQKIVSCSLLGLGILTALVARCGHTDAGNCSAPRSVSALQAWSFFCRSGGCDRSIAANDLEIPPMRLRESAIIAADAPTVWPFLADPVLQADWNPKVISIDRERSGPVQCGERFEMIYRMSGRENQTRVEVTVVQPAQQVVFRHHTTWKSQDQLVEESYEISSHGNGVKVVQTIDLRQAGIPWPFRSADLVYPSIWLECRRAVP